MEHPLISSMEFNRGKMEGAELSRRIPTLGQGVDTLSAVIALVSARGFVHLGEARERSAGSAPTQHPTMAHVYYSQSSRKARGTQEGGWGYSHRRSICQTTPRASKRCWFGSKPTDKGCGVHKGVLLKNITLVLFARHVWSRDKVQFRTIQ